MCAFKQIYNIGYKELFALPFSLFLVYLNGLPEHTNLIKVINLRAADYADIKDQNLLRLKKRYELKSDYQNHDQELARFANSLTKGN